MSSKHRRQFGDDLADAEKEYKPFLLIVPANAIDQWAEEIDRIWRCFLLAISYAEDDLKKAALRSHSILATTMKELRGKRAGLKKFKGTAQDRSYLFDRRERNSRTILLTSHDTHSSRHVFTQTIDIPAKSYSPPRFD